MTFEEFQAFIDEQDAFFRTLKRNRKGNERLFATTVKLGEEYGELCDAVLLQTGNQRKGKTGSLENLKGEIADVIIVAFLLAKVLDIDVQKALKTKIKMIREKHNKQLA